MSKQLYESCGACEGTGEFRGGVTARFEPQDLARVAALAERGVCPFCAGRRYLPIGLTVGQVEMLRDALERSVKLQSHYARLLNDWDGGERLTFGSAEEWISRLRAIDRERKRSDTA